MKIRNVLNSGYIGWIVVIAALIFWYFFYFFSYVPGQESKLRKRGFRILEEFSENMLEKHNYYTNHFVNYGPYYHLRDFFKNDSVYNESVIIETDETSTVELKKDSLPGVVHTALKLANSLDPTVNRQKGKTEIIFQKKGYNKRNEPSFYYNHDAYDEVYIVPLTTFMEGLRFDRLFESIVLFDSTEVFYNTDKEIVHDITNPGILLDSVIHQQGGFSKIITVRGEKKRALVLPVDIVQKRFYLAGIIPDQQFKKKTRSINFQVMIFVSGLLLVLLVGMPVLKIVLTDPYDHMDATDAQRTAISLIISTGILTLISIGSFHHKVVDRDYQKKRLTNISETIYGNVDKDLKMIIDFSRQLLGEDSLYTFRLSKFVRDSMKVNRFTKIRKDSVLPFPINEIILIDDQGLIKNAVSRTELSVDKSTMYFGEDKLDFKLIDLNQRLYFQNALDTTKSWYKKKYKKYLYIQSITSYNTGGKEAAISFYVKNKKDNKPNVLAITTELPSFYRQVLPDDVEFAIVNTTGDVLFHSIPSKNLHENFFNECGLNPDLTSAAGLRIIENTRVNYNEKSWIVRIKPIEDTPLLMVTLLDIQKMQNRNTRIILYTLYFFIIILICVIGGMLVIHLSRPKNSFIQSKSWLLNWLLFQSENYMRYKVFLFIILVIAFCQGIVAFIINKPVTMLVYQLLFIVFTGFISLVILGKRKLQIHRFYKKANLPPAIIVVIFIVLAILLIRLQLSFNLILPFAIITLLAFYVFNANSNKWLDNPESGKELKKYPLVPWRMGEGRHFRNDTFKPHGTVIRNIYNLSIFIWMLSLSFIPVLQFYRTIKNQEIIVNDRHKMVSVAQKNLSFENHFKNDTTSWLKRIRGNGIDGLEITYIEKSRTDSNLCVEEEEVLELNDRIYNLLSDPLTDGDGQMAFLRSKSYFCEWGIDNNKLSYSTPENAGIIRVELKRTESGNQLKWLLFVFPAAIILLLVWFIISYVNEYLLYTKQNKWRRYKPVPLKDIVFNDSPNRLLINTFDEKSLRQQAIGLINLVNNELTRPKYQLLILSYNDLLRPDFDPDESVSGDRKIIWISDLEQSFSRIHKHEELLNRLQMLHHKATGKIILLFPFELQFINEFFEDYISENKIEKQEKTEIFRLNRSWENSLRAYQRYFIPELPDDLHSDEIEEHSGRKLFYNYIWNNLTRNEKLVLYDLAKDGLVNLKNDKMIIRLMNKGLIVPGQYLTIFSKGFEYFINNSVNPTEQKKLVKSASFRGMWHNLRYPIIIVLVIIAAFVFISQGYSFEKVTAIFAGVFTLLATMVKLFERSG